MSTYLPDPVAVKTAANDVTTISHNAQQPSAILVLIVEDNLAQTRLIQEAFKIATQPYEFMTAKDGEVAMDFLQRHGTYQDAPRPDMVFLDLILPCKSGQEVLADMRNDPQLNRIPVVILTNLMNTEALAQNDKGQACCYMSKPSDATQLLEMVPKIEAFWREHGVLLQA